MGCHDTGSRTYGRGGNDKYERFNGFAYVHRRETKEEKQARLATVKRFLTNAKAGDVYETGVGFGSSGGTFQIVNYRGGKLGITTEGRHQTILLNTANAATYLMNANAATYLMNGAKLIKRDKTSK